MGVCGCGVRGDSMEPGEVDWSERKEGLVIDEFS